MVRVAESLLSVGTLTSVSSEPRVVVKFATYSKAGKVTIQKLELKGPLLVVSMMLGDRSWQWLSVLGDVKLVSTLKIKFCWPNR
jgi:hypothetical protein